MTVRIVPSTGCRTPRYATSLAARSASATAGESIVSAAPSTSAAPRTICERMTPELPRAPMSVARVTVCASAGRGASDAASSASTRARIVSAMFVPVSPSGTG